MEESRKQNGFVRTLVAILCLLLVAMAAYRFIFVEPIGRIDAALLAIIAIIVTLILSESFDNFSVGKIFTISREVKKKEEEVKKLETQNSQLLSQVLSIANSQRQTQSHISVSGDYHHVPVVQQATQDEVNTSRAREDVPSNLAEAIAVPQSRASIDHRKLEQLALEKYASTFSIDMEGLLREAKLASQMRDDDDPISRSLIIFDAYMSTPSVEVFIEVKLGGLSSMMHRDRLYVLLSKVYRYAQRRNIRARLDYVVATLPSRASSQDTPKRLADIFEPALASGLLQIVHLELTEEEEASIQRLPG